jgi:WD40 repeat protein
MAAPHIRVNNVDVLQGHQTPATEVRFSPDGSCLVTADDDTLRCWSVATRQAQWVLQVPAGLLAFAPHGHLLAHSTVGGIVHLRSLDGALVAELPPHDPVATSLTFSPSGNVLATGDLAGDVRFWEVATQRLVLSFHANLGPALEERPTRFGGVAHREAVDLLTFTPDGSRMVVESQDQRGRLQLWRIEESIPRVAWEAAALGARDLSFDLRCSPDGRLLAFAHFDKQVINLFDAHTLRPTGQIDLDTRLRNDATKCIAFSPDSRWLAIGSGGGWVLIWDIPSGRIIADFVAHDGSVFAITGADWDIGGIDWSPNAGLIATTGTSYATRYDAATRGFLGPPDYSVKLWEVIEMPRSADHMA